MKTIALLVSIGVFAGALSAQTSGAVTPTPKQQFADLNGKPIAGGLVCTYAAGTTTPLATYTDASISTPNTNPVVLDSQGRAAIWLGAAAYKVVLTNPGDTTCASPVWTIDQVSDIGLILKLNLGLTTTGNGAALVGWKSGGTGAVSQTVQTKLAQTVSPLDFGAKCDGTTVDTTALKNMISYLGSLGPSTDNGATGLLPPGYCVADQSLDLPANVVIQGQSTTASGIIAKSGGSFSTYTDSGGTARTYLISIGGSLTTPVEGAQWRNLDLVCQNAVYTCFQTKSAEENSGLFNSYVTGYTGYGIDVVGFGTQNSSFDYDTFYAGSGAFGSHCAHFYQSNSRTSFNHFTCNGDLASSAQTTSGIKLEAGSHMNVGQGHCEGYAMCVEVVDSFVTVSDIVENDDTPDTMIVLDIHGASSVHASNIVKFFPGNQITICDETQTGTQTCGTGTNVVEMNEIIESGYISEWNASGLGKSVRNLISSNSANFSNIALLNSNLLQIYNIAQITNYSTGTLTFRQLNGNFSGFNFQSSQLTTPGNTGGGAFIGSSFQNDPSAGSFGGGVQTDSGTFTARATSGSGMDCIGGQCLFYANTGLTNGSTYTPTFPFMIGSTGPRIKVLASNPGCNTGNSGLLWINTGASPTRYEYCDGTNWYYSTPIVGP